jgi:hypothetical protein
MRDAVSLPSDAALSIARGTTSGAGAESRGSRVRVRGTLSLVDDRVIAAPAMLLALWDCETRVIQGATAGQAMYSAVQLFGVNQGELGLFWLQKLVERERARVWLAQPE